MGESKWKSKIFVKLYKYVYDYTQFSAPLKNEKKRTRKRFNCLWWKKNEKKIKECIIEEKMNETILCYNNKQHYISIRMNVIYWHLNIKYMTFKRSENNASTEKCRYGFDDFNTLTVRYYLNNLIFCTNT